MAIQKILTAPHPLLQQKSKPVRRINERTRKIAQDLIEILKATHEPKGKGLSAVQIGKPVRIFIAEIGKKFEIFINPKISWFSKKTLSEVLEEDQLFFEGCLSLPDIYGFVDRPWKVKMAWQDLSGKDRTAEFMAKQAVCVQHELDHLDGILFTQRVLAQKGKIYQLKKNQEGEEIFEEITPQI